MVKDDDESAEASGYPVVALVVATVVVAWFATPIVVSNYFPVSSEMTLQAAMAARGQLGDIYGSINALFSGLAFVGVVVAVLLQSRELRLQRQELKANRLVSTQAAEAQEKTQHALQQTANAQVYRMAAEWLQGREIRTARSVVFTNLASIPLDQWGDVHVQTADEVCRSYDSVGKLVRYGLLPEEFVVDSWGEAIGRSWAILKPRVDHIRTSRASPNYCKGYEALVVAAERLKQVSAGNL